MTDEIQQLINIDNRISALQYLRNSNKRAMRLVACRMMHKGEDDNKYISQITLCRHDEIERLRELLTMEQAMVELGLSKKSLGKYIQQGLTVQDDTIPRYAIEIMENDPSYFILMQKGHQDEKLRTQTEEQYLQNVEDRITEYEQEFGGSFEELYGHLTTCEIDGMDDPMDLMIWRDLTVELREIRSKKGE